MAKELIFLAFELALDTWIRGYEVNCRRSRNVDNQLITRKKLNNAHTISILKADISV